MRTSTAALVLTSATGASAFAVAPLAVAPTPALRSPAPAMQSDPYQRWKEPIFDSNRPDPVWDESSPYTGRVPYGFSEAAEKLNGRAAMMGFTILFLQELVCGKGVLELYGLPYDAGAVLIK